MISAFALPPTRKPISSPRIQFRPRPLPVISLRTSPAPFTPKTESRQRRTARKFDFSKDADLTLQLAADLNNAGVRLWMDQLDGILAALHRCSAMIPVLTPADNNR